MAWGYPYWNSWAGAGWSGLGALSPVVYGVNPALGLGWGGYGWGGYGYARRGVCGTFGCI